MILIRGTEEDVVDDLHDLGTGDLVLRAERAVLIAADQTELRRAVDVVARPAVGDIGEGIVLDLRRMEEQRRDRRELCAGDVLLRAECAVLVAGEDAAVGERGDLTGVPALSRDIRVRALGGPDLLTAVISQDAVEDRGDLGTRDRSARCDRTVRITGDVRVVVIALQRRRRQLVVLCGEDELDVRGRFLEGVAHRGVDLNGHVQLDRVCLREDLGNEDVALESVGRVELVKEARVLVGREHLAVLRHGHVDVAEHIVVLDGGALLGGGVAVDLGAEVDLRALRAVGAVGLDADGLREAVAGHAVGEIGKQVRRRALAGVGKGEARVVAVVAVIVGDGGELFLARRPDAQPRGQRDHQHEGDDHGKLFVFHTAALLMVSWSAASDGRCCQRPRPSSAAQPRSVRPECSRPAPSPRGDNPRVQCPA